MTRHNHDPSLFHGVVAALVFSLCGAALLAALTPIVGAASALRAVVALLGLAYLLYLLGRSGERTGRITTVAVWSVATAAIWFAEPPLAVFVLLHACMIWLVRSLYHHSSVLSALGDLALSTLAVAFAAWAASRSGSVWLALWCFFLVQAFFALLPSPMGGAIGGAIGGGARGGARVEDGEAFERAHRAAQAALRRLAETRRA
jgi:hypothetical protein